jgi:hypothetical protein
MFAKFNGVGETGIGINVTGNSYLELGNEQITARYPIDMRSKQITNVADPTFQQSVATKNYVDYIKCYEGVVPRLEANDSKTGFICSASSEYSANYLAYNAFASTSAEWATYFITSNFWIKIYCPDPIKVCGFRISGRTNRGAGRICDWRFDASSDDNTWHTLLSTSTCIDSGVYKYDVHTPNLYQWFRIYVINADANNPGLRYFQIYKYLNN